MLYFLVSHPTIIERLALQARVSLLHRKTRLCAVAYLLGNFSLYLNINLNLRANRYTLPTSALTHSVRSITSYLSLPNRREEGEAYLVVVAT
jgi:hypothetical protein